MGIIRNIAVALLAAGISFSAGAAASYDGDEVKKQENAMVGNDYQIVRDETVDGIRYVTAIPSEKVCSNKIEIELSGNIIRKVVFTRGCNGNGKGIGALIEGMTVEEAVKRLKGINCNSRGTSCPDQLARVLETACLK
ncbi:MAG: TIGR03905 family TSCPD domain-containing protein [Candidatus Cryptobacteroides sp.]